MEVLLLQDVPGVGKKNDLLIVRDGYALNHLLPHRKALVATPTVRRRYADQIRRRAEEKQREVALKTSTAGRLTGKEISFSKKATKTGKLYAALTEKAITEAIAQQLHVDVQEEAVAIPSPIKALGTFDVHVTIGDITQSLKINVNAEQ